MPATKTREKTYRRRHRECVRNVTFDHEALKILTHFCPAGERGTGRFLSQLLHEHLARVEERQRLQALRQIVLAEEEESGK